MPETFDSANRGQSQRPYFPKQRRCHGEDAAWAQLYQTIGQPSTAEEVVKLLDADRDARQSHLGLIMQAKITLRRHKAIEARNQRIAAALRLLLVVPFRLLKAIAFYATGVAIEMLPLAKREPARARSSALKSDPDFARSTDRFGTNAEGVAPVTGESRNSRDRTKAA